MDPESLAARIRNLLASNPELTLYVQDDRLYAGYFHPDGEDDVFVIDVSP